MTASIEVTRSNVRARPSGFVRDLLTIARRALRAVPREPEVFAPALFIPAFFFIVNIGALQDLTESFPGAEGFSYRNFQLPTAIIFAVTGISRAPAVVIDIQTGYFDRLLLSPVRRLPLLLGLMMADFALVIGTPPTMLAYGTGLFSTGEVLRKGTPLDLVGLVLLVFVVTNLWQLFSLV